MLCAAEPIHVMIWAKRQPRQSQAYDNFLDTEIARQPKKAANDVEIRSVTLDDADQGLTDGNLEWADVIENACRWLGTPPAE